MTAMNIISWILWALLFIPVAYLTLFAILSLAAKRYRYPAGRRTDSFVVLIPAYKSDSTILQTAQSALGQDYTAGKFRVLVISDSMRADTVEALRQAGAEVLEVSFENSTKAKSLNAAMEHLGPHAADRIVILDADNIVGESFLSLLDDAFCDGVRAVQAHRCAANRDTDVAVLDAASEEINNSIFRKGHCAAGLSSALIGSGMAFEYSWFAQACKSLVTSGEDKELELRLLSDGIFIEYLDYVKVRDEKTRTGGNYYNQHRRWTASQYNILPAALRGFKDAKDKKGYADKLLQWMFPSRMMLTGLIPVLAAAASILGLSNARTWWELFVMLAVAMLLALPQEHLDAKLWKSLIKAPLLAAMAVANLFRMKGTKDKFIHTEH